jgi:aldose 1-epimerase
MNPLSLLAATILGLASVAQAVADVSVRPLGRLPDGRPVHEFTITNPNGMKVVLMDYGATVMKLFVPDRNGKLGDVVLGFDTLQGYLSKGNPYFGAIVGRYANRIANGIFTLDGRTWKLPVNDGPNQLHGGPKGFDKRLWHGKLVPRTNAVCFTRRSPAGEEGYPGDLDVAVTYTLKNDNTLRIDYRATTDAPTVLNLSNHMYFNLAGAGNGTVLGQTLRLHAGKYTPVNSALIPTGQIASVRGTPFDFRKPTAIGAHLRETGGKPVGYDHNFVLSRCPFGGRTFAAEVYDPTSGRMLKVCTTQPGVQFYTGNFLDGIKGKGGKAYPQYSALCLETQHFPDSPNHPNFPSTVLRPGQVFRSTTTYAFRTK